MSLLRFVVPAVLVLSACGGPQTLELLVPARMDSGGTIKVQAVALANGKAGAGTVEFEASDGTFPSGASIRLDADGIASTTFACEPSCLEGRSFTITAKWTTGKSTAEAIARTRVETRSSDGGQAATGGGPSWTGGIPRTAAEYLPYCFTQVRPTPDEITVIGTAHELGGVDLRLRGGSSAGTPLDRMGGDYATRPGLVSGSPADVGNVGLVLYPTTTEITPGVLYSQTNQPDSSGRNFMGFTIASLASTALCPKGSGAGTFVFDRVMFSSAKDGGYSSGAYTFSCPAKAIDVYGCFAYH